MKIIELKDAVQDCNLNFLIGSGLSFPYLRLLGNIEALLTQLDNRKLPIKRRALIEASLFKEYFDGVIARNSSIAVRSEDARQVLDGYKALLRTINSILLRRKSTILNKQVNLFTTNADIFLEIALEELGLEHNDGFAGRFHPRFSLNNFRKLQFRSSQQFENISEFPLFNILKIHGSVNWRRDDQSDAIVCDTSLSTIEAIQNQGLPDICQIPLETTSTIESLMTAANQKVYRSAIDKFLEAYRNLLIVNPTKRKFEDTVLNQTYYDLLRHFSNELEKENSVLFVLGFSFADEHIRELTLRAADSNPTLTEFIFAHRSDSFAELDGRLNATNAKHRNVKIVSPPTVELEGGGGLRDEYQHDLVGLNDHVFNTLLSSIEEQAR